MIAFKTITILVGLAFILIVSLNKLIQDNQFKKVAKEGKNFMQEFIDNGLSKKEAYKRLTPEHKRAINKCERLKLKY